MYDSELNNASVEYNSETQYFEAWTPDHPEIMGYGSTADYAMIDLESELKELKEK
jgi:hypothetical protein